MGGAVHSAGRPACCCNTVAFAVASGYTFGWMFGTLGTGLTLWTGGWHTRCFVSWSELCKCSRCSCSVKCVKTKGNPFGPSSLSVNLRFVRGFSARNCFTPSMRYANVGTLMNFAMSEPVNPNFACAKDRTCIPVALASRRRMFRSAVRKWVINVGCSRFK